MGLRNPLNPSQSIQAVLFDLDGTLYHQMPVRLLMAAELLTLPLVAPRTAGRRLRALRAYRHAQESLRGNAPYEGSIADLQVSHAAAAAGLSREEVAELVSEWMLRRPLKYLRFSRMKGIVQLLDLLSREGVRSGVFSDYPAEAKLEALGLAGRFSPVLCSTDAAIGAFKPNPRGFLLACATWGLAPSEVLMVGDRADVDAAGARAAGMPCIILGGNSADSGKGDGYLALPSFERLYRVFEGA